METRIISLCVIRHGKQLCFCLLWTKFWENSMVHLRNTKKEISNNTCVLYFWRKCPHRNIECKLPTCATNGSVVTTKESVWLAEKHIGYIGKNQKISFEIYLFDWVGVVSMKKKGGVKMDKRWWEFLLLSPPFIPNLSKYFFGTIFPFLWDNLNHLEW